MPQLDPNLWIEGGYYVDFDLLDQFRIIGPNNHLYCGFIDIPRHRLVIDKVEATAENTCIIHGRFLKNTMNLYHPIMGDMRTIRALSVDPQTNEQRTYIEMRRQETSDSAPMWIHKTVGANGKALVFRRSYGEHWYGTTFIFPKGTSIRVLQRPFGGFAIAAPGKRDIPFTITAETNDISDLHYRCSVLPTEALDWKIFGAEAKVIKKFWERSKVEVDHLITWGKTSGDRFGTVFPRDWMESVLLGAGDIPAEIVDEMVVRCLANVDSRGRSWHEDVVGEFRYRHQLSGSDLFNRKMIDIEPLTLIALRYVSPYFWTRHEAVAKLRRMAKYVAGRARSKMFIAFKRHSRSHATKAEPYHLVGDWRDSTWAFKKIHPHLAPFDVNAVLYPLALMEMDSLYNKLGLRIPGLTQLIKRWEKKLGDYAFQNPDKLPAYALAVYGFTVNRALTKTKVKFEQLKVNQLDECYRYALTHGAESELVSFCKRLNDPEYFHTDSGPTLVAANNHMGYTSQEYHGLVIWTKQVAFSVLGLTRHLAHGKAQQWKPASLKLIRSTALDLCRIMVKTFAKLNAIPELHFDDHGTPKFFTDQQAVGERMSKVQLWSAVGARRIFREYYKLLQGKV